MKMKNNPGLGLTMPKRVRIAGMTFYMRNGQESDESQRHTLPVATLNYFGCRLWRYSLGD
jgi:hypothetical protein